MEIPTWDPPPLYGIHRVNVHQYSFQIIRAFKAGVVPVVMGGSWSLLFSFDPVRRFGLSTGANYSAIFPPNSFIDVTNYKSPAKLAEYLQLLASNPFLYRKHLLWRLETKYTQLPPFLSPNNVALCKLCRLLNENPRPQKRYESVDQWFASGSDCRQGSWDNKKWPFSL